ncbi:MAG: hypothetical protein ABIH70_04140 [Chloroflexota bacterium]
MVIAKAPKARKIVDELYACGVTHFVYVVDHASRFICDILSDEGRLTMVPVCREGETFAIAAGLITGGKKPVVFMEHTGFLESGDSVRFLVVDINLPLLILISDRGWSKNGPINDSGATFIEPTLKAWGIKHHLVETAQDTECVSKAYQECQKRSKAVAILITPELTPEG